jgi:hypothetical protein
MKKHAFLTMELDDSGFHYAKFEHLVQGSIRALSIRATEDSDGGVLDNVWFIHNPDRHKPKASRPPDDLVCVHIENVTMVPHDNEASIKSVVDEEPDFSGGLAIVVDATISTASELHVVVSVDV